MFWRNSCNWHPGSLSIFWISTVVKSFFRDIWRTKSSLFITDGKKLYDKSPVKHFLDLILEFSFIHYIGERKLQEKERSIKNRQRARLSSVIFLSRPLKKKSKNCSGKLYNCQTCCHKWRWISESVRPNIIKLNSLFKQIPAQTKLEFEGSKLEEFIHDFDGIMITKNIKLNLSETLLSQVHLDIQN